MTSGESPTDPHPSPTPLSYQSGHDAAAEQSATRRRRRAWFFRSPAFPAAIVAGCGVVALVVDDANQGPWPIMVPVIWGAGIAYILARIRSEPPGALRVCRGAVAVGTYVVLVTLLIGNGLRDLLTLLRGYGWYFKPDDQTWSTILGSVLPVALYGVLDVIHLFRWIRGRNPAKMPVSEPCD